MMEVKLLIEGGKATAGPPIGPTLSPLGLPVGKVVADINKATAQYSGITVPVILKVDPATKEYTIEVGTPPTSALIKKEMKIDKGAQSPGSEWVGDITLEKILEIAKTKLSEMNTQDLKSAVLQVLGTCVSMGVKVNGMDPREVQRKIKNGEIEIQ